jgi:hypothetical protein
MFVLPPVDGVVLLASSWLDKDGLQPAICRCANITGHAVADGSKPVHYRQG